MNIALCNDLVANNYVPHPALHINAARQQLRANIDWPLRFIRVIKLPSGEVRHADVRVQSEAFQLQYDIFDHHIVTGTLRSYDRENWVMMIPAIYLNNINQVEWNRIINITRDMVSVAGLCTTQNAVDVSTPTFSFSKSSILPGFGDAITKTIKRPTSKNSIGPAFKSQTYKY